MSVAPPWRLPPSDPFEGSHDEAMKLARSLVAVGQFWACGQRCAFEITEIAGENALGMLRSFEDSGVEQWSRRHFFWLPWFVGRLHRQERRPVLWQRSVDRPPADDPTIARARLLEVD